MRSVRGNTKMQDRYAGDVGDFGKFSLLRSVFVKPEKKIGVVWYKFPDESHNGDGRHIDYLYNNNYKACDNDLVDKLSHIVAVDRSISKLESLSLLPSHTVYYADKLDFHIIYPGQTHADRMARRNGRLEWLQNAATTVKDCNIIFLDPDNGLEIQSIPNLHQVKSGKYAYYSEVMELFKNKDACVIYHHMNMNSPHESQIKHRAHALKNTIVKNGSVFAIRFSPYSPRAFFVCASQQSASEIKNKINNFMSGACGLGWDTYYEA